MLADNRQEWLITDMAIQIAGGVCVPRGSDSSAGEIRFILEHSNSKIVFIEHFRLYKKIAEILSDLKCRNRHIIFGKEYGSKSSYGHMDIVCGINAPEETWTAALEWIIANED